MIDIKGGSEWNFNRCRRLIKLIFYLFRPCMLVPIIGELLAQISLILSVYFKSWPMEVAGISEVIFPGLSGSWFLMFLVGF